MADSLTAACQTLRQLLRFRLVVLLCGVRHGDNPYTLCYDIEAAAVETLQSVDNERGVGRGRRIPLRFL